MTLWIPRNGSKGRNKIMEQPTHGRIEEKICWSHVCLWGEPQGTRLNGQLLIPVTPPPPSLLELDKQTSLPRMMKRRDGSATLSSLASARAY